RHARRLRPPPQKPPDPFHESLTTDERSASSLTIARRSFPRDITWYNAPANSIRNDRAMTPSYSAHRPAARRLRTRFTND
ncbi:MAG: hypothetical protein ACPMAQ_13130, partial [Phycisphaerae bacterium]